MRSHSKLLLTVAVAILNPVLTATPAYAEGRAAGSLSLSEIQSAFGGADKDGNPSFGIKHQDGDLSFLGFAEVKCLTGESPVLKISCDGASGTFQVEYNGKDASCLQPAADGAQTQSLPTLEQGGHCKLTGDFDKFQLRTLKRNGDESLVEVKDAKGESIANVSEAKKKSNEADQKKKDEEKKGTVAKLRQQYLESVLDHCLKSDGADAADASQDAYDSLVAIQGYLDGREKDDAGWADKTKTRISKSRIAAWKTLFSSGSIADFADAVSRIEKSVDAEQMEDSDAHDLYVLGMKRLIGANAGTPKDLESISKAYDELILRLKGDADDETDSEVAKLDHDYQLAQINRAAQLGTGDEFDAASLKFRTYLADKGDGCVLADAKNPATYGHFDIRMMRNPACAGAFQMDQMLNGVTLQAKQIAAENLFQSQLQACQTSDLAGMPRTADCNAVLAKQKARDDAAKTAAGNTSTATSSDPNAGVSGTANGTVTTSPSTPGDARTPAGTTTSANAQTSGAQHTVFNQTTPQQVAPQTQPVHVIRR